MIRENLRKEFLEKRRNLSQKEVQTASQKVCGKLKKLPQIMQAKAIALYYPTQNEIDLLDLIKELLAQKKELYFPRFEKDAYVFTQILHPQEKFIIGKYGIYELNKNNPTLSLLESQKKIDVWCVPGVVFAKKGHRLGFGKGYYDQFLKKVKGCKVGICYDWQIVEEIPINKEDVAMDLVICNLF